MKINFSGLLYEAHGYTLNENLSYRYGYGKRYALKERPQVIIAGWSAYPRHLDFEAFRSIADEVGAVLWTDMALFMGLVAARLHPNFYRVSMMLYQLPFTKQIWRNSSFRHDLVRYN